METSFKKQSEDHNMIVQLPVFAFTIREMGYFKETNLFQVEHSHQEVVTKIPKYLSLWEIGNFHLKFKLSNELTR